MGWIGVYMGADTLEGDRDDRHTWLGADGQQAKKFVNTFIIPAVL